MRIGPPEVLHLVFPSLRDGCLTAWASPYAAVFLDAGLHKACELGTGGSAARHSANEQTCTLF